MPELPEVEAARALIERRGLNRLIAEVDDTDTYVCRPHVPGEIADALVGATLTAAHRRGKALWVETDGGPILGLHLGMAGKIVIDGAEAGEVKPDGPVLVRRWDRFTIRFADGGALILRDKRRLGRAVLEPDVGRLGIDAAVVDRATFRKKIGAGDAPIKARLLDQSAIAGIGNLLADEALWHARISPRRSTGSLREDELDRLRREIRAAIRSALRKGGVHTGHFIEHRERGGRCPRCGTPLERATIGGRTTYWCPREQPDDAPA